MPCIYIKKNLNKNFFLDNLNICLMIIFKDHHIGCWILKAQYAPAYYKVRAIGMFYSQLVLKQNICTKFQLSLISVCFDSYHSTSPCFFEGVDCSLSGMEQILSQTIFCQKYYQNFVTLCSNCVFTISCVNYKNYHIDPQQRTSFFCKYSYSCRQHSLLSFLYTTASSAITLDRCMWCCADNRRNYLFCLFENFVFLYQE